MIFCDVYNEKKVMDSEDISAYIVQFIKNKSVE